MDGKIYSASKLAYFYIRGEWPLRRLVVKGSGYGGLQVGRDKAPKGLKRPPANSEEERLQRRREQFNRWYEKNGPSPWTPERGKIQAACARRYRKRHPEKVTAQKAERRARELNASGRHTAEDLKEILHAQRNKCAYCKIKLSAKNKHLDHIFSLARGGSNDRRNLQFLCSFCNQRKSAKDALVFCRQQGMLL